MVCAPPPRAGYGKCAAMVVRPGRAAKDPTVPLVWTVNRVGQEVEPSAGVGECVKVVFTEQVKYLGVRSWTAGCRGCPMCAG